MAFLKSRRSWRAQTVIEFAGAMIVFSMFFGLCYYMSAIFTVAHQQTMLNRTQAFIELGNYSYFGGAKHGEDDVEDDQSKVFFQMGTKSSGTVVSFDQQKEFKEATEGELELQVLMPRDQQDYWSKFEFPRAITTILWPQRDDETPAQVRLTSFLAIVHNRSLDLSSGPSGFNSDETGLYSGSMHFNEYSRVAGLSRQMASGMIDNVDLIKNVLKDLVRNDSSLSDEAADLERSLNVAESITGGGISALISLAISAAAWGFQELVASAAAASGAAGSAAAGAEGIGGAFADPVSAGTQVVSGTFGESLVNFVTAPFQATAQGISSFTSGLSGLVSTAPAWGDAWQAMYGLSQLGQMTQMGLSVAGKSVQGLNIAVAALALPYGVQSGLEQFDSAMNNPNFEGGKDIAGAIQAIPQIVSPVTNFIVQVAPDSSLPISYLNAGLGAASALAGLPGNIGELSSGSLKTLDAVIKVGEITNGVGALVSNVAYLAGEDQTIGGYLQMAGGGMIAIGNAGKLIEHLKVEGINIGNPFELAGGILKENFDGAARALDNFGKEMEMAGKQISAAWSDMFGPALTSNDLQMTPGLKDLIDKTTGDFSSDRVSGRLTRMDLLKIDAVLDRLEPALRLQAVASGIQDDGSLSANFKDLRASLVELGRGGPVTSEMLAALNKGAEATKALNGFVDSQFAQKLNDRNLAQAQIRGMMYGNSQVNIAKNLVNSGQTYKDGVALEKEYKANNPFAHFMESFTGGRMSDRLIQQQVDAAQELVMQVAKSKQEIPEDFKGDRNQLAVEIRNRAAEEILSRAEVISVHGPISTDNVGELKKGAYESAQILKSYRDDPTLKHNDNVRIRINAAIDKLEGLSSGRIAVDTGGATIRYIAQQLEEREARYQRAKSILVSCRQGKC